jgi:integrase/recombinase XerC
MALSSATIWEHYRTFLLVDAVGGYGYSPATVHSYRSVLWDFWAFLDPKPWRKATPADLRRFLDRPARSGRTKGHRLAPNTRLQYASIICSFHAWAHLYEHTGRNPMAKVKLPKGGTPTARNFDHDQLREILCSAEVLDDRLYVMAALAYGAGLRCAEIAGLRVEDVHLDRRGWLKVLGKGRKNRVLPLGPEVKAAIVRMLATRGSPRTGPLVASRGPRPGEQMTPGSVSRALSNHIRKHCGIDGSGHALRHSFAQELIAAAGQDKLMTVSRLLGHEDTRVTDRVYLRGWQGEPEHVLEKLPFPTRRGVSP